MFGNIRVMDSNRIKNKTGNLRVIKREGKVQMSICHINNANKSNGS